MDKEHAAITLSVLRWARETAGYSVDDVAQKLKVKASRISGWEDGSVPLTFDRLERLARFYKRPTSFFFMPAPPDEREVQVPDFRAKTLISPELRFQLRHARERREIALQLAEELGQRVPAFGLTLLRNEPSEEAGARLRAHLGMLDDAHEHWNGKAYAALNAWKDSAERRGVLVFQASRKNLGGARGVSVWFPALPVVILPSEAPSGRSFSLLHELAHLALRQGGICDLHDAHDELYANEVAAAALMPASSVLQKMNQLGAKAPFED